MVEYKKLKDPVILTMHIEREQHEALRTLSFNSRKSMSAFVRAAIEIFLRDLKKKAKTK